MCGAQFRAHLARLGDFAVSELQTGDVLRTRMASDAIFLGAPALEEKFHDILAAHSKKSVAGFLLRDKAAGNMQLPAKETCLLSSSASKFIWTVGQANIEVVPSSMQYPTLSKLVKVVLRRMLVRCKRFDSPYVSVCLRICKSEGPSEKMRCAKTCLPKLWNFWVL